MIKILTQSEILDNLKRQSQKLKSTYYGVYSSWHQGLILDRDLMMIPLDDHLVHRGDGVFEAIKVIGKKPYLLKDHLNRLLISAQFLKLPLPYPIERLEKIIFECLDLLTTPEISLIRMFVSRGPGDFSTNPKSTIGSQVYIAFTDCNVVSEQQRIKGFHIGFAATPAKEKWIAPYKTCNYIQNVMLKGEAIENNWDLAVAHHQGQLTESSTENIFWINADGDLCAPELNSILKGTMMNRAMELAQKNLNIKFRFEPIQIDHLSLQKEILIAGTTWDVQRVSKIQGKDLVVPIYENSMAKKLYDLIKTDQDLL
jgi:4-amino-4-deoxychorismate lyase